MHQVNLFLEQTIKSGPRRNGHFYYLFEFQGENNMETREAHGSLENVTANQMELIVLQDALKRLTKPCTVTIYSSQNHFKNVYVNQWMNTWKENNWMNAKGQVVANKLEWEKIMPELARHRVITGPTGNHQYSKYMESSMRNMEEVDEIN